MGDLNSVRNKALYSKHFLMLSLLFILGNACIVSPVEGADKYNFFVFLVSCLLSMALAFVAYFIPINRVSVIPIYLLCFYVFGDSLIIFLKFISDSLLSNTSKLFTVLPLIVVLVYLAFKKKDTLFKFTLICGVFTLAVILFFFLATLKDFNVKNIIIYKLPSLDNLFFQSIFYIKTLSLPSVLLGIFAKQEKIKKGILIGGLGLGLLCFAVTVLNSVLLFGIEFSGRLDYPYSAAGSTVTFGNLFTRLDGFLYFVYAATCITKCTIAIFTIKKSASEIGC